MNKQNKKQKQHKDSLNIGKSSPVTIQTIAARTTNLTNPQLQQQLPSTVASSDELIPETRRGTDRYITPMANTTDNVQTNITVVNGDHDESSSNEDLYDEGLKVKTTNNSNSNHAELGHTNSYQSSSASIYGQKIKQTTGSRTSDKLVSRNILDKLKSNPSTHDIDHDGPGIDKQISTMSIEPEIAQSDYAQASGVATDGNTRIKRVGESSIF